MRLDSLWNQAHLHGDAGTLNELWAADLIVTVPGMSPMSKDESMAFFQSAVMHFEEYRSFDLVVRVYGDAAVVTGRLERVRTLRGQRAADDWRFTKVYVREGGTWRVVAFHASTSPSE